MRIRGIRGAIQLDQDTPDEMISAVSELLAQMLTSNQLETEDLISIIFTATPDLTSEFPAVAARKIGLGNVPLLCSVEIDVPQALPKVVRILLHAQLNRPLAEVKHIYLRGATVLRKDLAPMIKKVRIVGAGLIGTSVGLRLKASGSLVEIIDINSSAMKLAADLVKSEAIAEPDLIIITVPISANAKMVIEQLNNNPRSIVCDFASVKSDLLLKVEELSANSHNFISLHPMAGREINGAENARADLFEGRAWIGITDSFSEAKNKEIAQNLVQMCGGTLYWLSSKEHDDLVAKISHLPQILSTVIAGSLENISNENLNLSGQGLRDLTRLASADALLWSQILTENNGSITPVIDLVISHLQDVKQSIASKNSNELIEFLNKGDRGKNRIPGKHGAKHRDYSYLPIVIDDKPGELARIFNECAKVSVNIEDLSIEHSPGQETGLITLALSNDDCNKLSKHLENLGFKVHPAKNR